MRWRVTAGFAVAVACVGAGRVSAQVPPGYSPYLNLARPGNAGINYYGLVRPQIEIRSQVQQLQQNAATLRGDLSQLSGTGDLTTGHPVGYMYFGGYYPSLGRGGAPARTLPGAPRPPTPSAPTPYRR